MKPPIHYAGNNPNYFWKFLLNLGFDWRNPERLKFFEPPNKGVAVTNSYLSGLFNAANKAIHENQQELLSASLFSIGTILRTYTKVRRSYYGSTDFVFTYTNDQMAALLKASSKSPNEYLILEIVRYIGSIGSLSLQISELPKNIEKGRPKRDMPKDHTLSLAWLGLLGEGFEHSHFLMRSTAASEAIFAITWI